MSTLLDHCTSFLITPISCSNEQNRDGPPFQVLFPVGNTSIPKLNTPVFQ